MLRSLRRANRQTRATSANQRSPNRRYPDPQLLRRCSGGASCRSRPRPRRCWNRACARRTTQHSCGRRPQLPWCCGHFRSGCNEGHAYCATCTHLFMRPGHAVHRHGATFGTRHERARAGRRTCHGQLQHDTSNSMRRPSGGRVRDDTFRPSRDDLMRLMMSRAKETPRSLGPGPA